MPLVSKHFAYGEFTSHDGVPYPVDWINDRLQPLCEMLDAIRELWGGPIHVVSGYRSPEYNERLRARSSGVAEHSQHPQGRAADIAPVPATRESVLRLAAVIDGMIAAGKLPLVGGFGRYPSWCHVDVRPRHSNGEIARWDGAGFGSEPVA